MLPGLAILLAAFTFFLLNRSSLLAAEDKPVAGVAVLEGEAYYWPVLSGETQARENDLVILERDAQVISLQAGIEFQSQAKDIIPESFPVLDKLYEVLLANPDLIVLITVQAEKTSKTETGLGLARERAGQVKDYLVTKGIEASRLETQGRGPSAERKKAEDRSRKEEPPATIAITEQDKDLNPRWMKLKNNTDFYANDEIKTGNGKVKILFPSGTILALSPHAYLKVINGSRVKLFRGKLLTDAGKSLDHQEFQTETVNANISTKEAICFLNFLNGISTIISLKGEISASGKQEPEKNLPLARGKKIIMQTGQIPGKPETVNPGEAENILSEFNLKNFDQSQSLYDEEIKKRLEMNKPVAPEKKSAPAPVPVNQVTSPAAATQTVTPSP